MGHTLPTTSQELPSTSKNPKVPLGDFFEELTLDTDKKGKGKLEENPHEEHWEVIRELWVTKVVQDDPLKVVYKDASEAYYSTTRLPNVELPLSQFLMVERLSEIIHRVCDKYGNQYRTMDWFEVRGLMYQGQLLFREVQPQATARPEENAFYGETIAPTFNVHSRPRPASSEHTTARGPVLQPTAPPIAMMRSHNNSRPGLPGYADRRIAGHAAITEPIRPHTRAPEVSFPVRPRDFTGEEGVRGSTPGIDAYRPPELPREEGPRTRGRRNDDEYTRKVRPSTLQKLVKKYDGSGDPYDHVASFRQAIRAEQVTDKHTQIEGFGLTLEGKALSWFQALDNADITSLSGLEKSFVAAFSMMGLQHDTIALIYSFKQGEKENVRDCVNRMKQYVNRCLDSKKPSQSRLVSLFLKGLLNETLHAHLYAKKHTLFNECCLDAMEGRTQDWWNIDRSSQGNSNFSELPNADQIADMVLRRLGQTYKPYGRPQ